MIVVAYQESISVSVISVGIKNYSCAGGGKKWDRIKAIRIEEGIVEFRKEYLVSSF